MRPDGVHAENLKSSVLIPVCNVPTHNMYQMLLSANIKQTWCQMMVMMIILNFESSKSINRFLSYPMDSSEAIALCLDECILS